MRNPGGLNSTVQKVQMLADRFADFNVKSDKGKTPLM